MLLRRQRTQACAVSQAGNGRRRGRRHKEPKPTRRRGSCVAAPEKGKQLIRVGQRGASGGMQGGPRRGRSPITGPALPTPEAAQTTIIKSPRARRAQKSPLKGQARFHCPCRPPRRRPKQHQNKPRARRAQKITLKRQALLYCSYANPNEPFPNNNHHFWDSIQPIRRSPPFHPALYRPLALRGAQGDRRAQRGSSRSRSRAALVEWRDMEGP